MPALVPYFLILRGCRLIPVLASDMQGRNNLTGFRLFKAWIILVLFLFCISLFYDTSDRGGFDPLLPHHAAYRSVLRGSIVYTYF